MFIKILSSMALVSSLFFIACGDDSGSNSVEKGTKDVIALADGSGEKVCDEKLDGWVAEAVGKDFRRCLDGEWTKISAKEASAEEEIIGGATLFLNSSSAKSSSSAVSSSSATSSSSFVSSSSVKSSSSAASSSSVASSSSAKSSSSAVSSSSATSSSSFVSSSSVKSSSSAASSSSVASSSSAKSSSSAVSSSSATSSSSFVSSSSVKSSSSAASSSSVASSSSAKSSSSAESSSSVESSSSIEKLVWQYLNPAISYGEIIDDRDGQVYKTVEIGSQTWMAENLNYDYNYRTARSYCYADSCSKYGRLYTWSATVDSAAVFSTAGKGCGCHASSSPRGIVRGVCPVGWHVPSVSEFQTLISYVGGYSVAGANLKSTSGWKSNSQYVGNGSDSNGFSALPAGAYNDAITYHVYRFYDVGNFAFFWTTSKGSCVADRLRLGWADDSSNLTNSLSDDVDRGDMDSARSVRCLKD